MGAKVLVTGATGFLGSAVVRALLAGGFRVRALVRSPEKATTLHQLPVELAEGDLLRRGEVVRALTGVTAVIHAAAFVSFRPRDEEKLRQVNVGGTQLLLEEAARLGIRALHTSSTATIGLTAAPVLLDESAPLRHPGELGIPYVTSKVDGERLALDLAARGADIVVMNPGMLMGPGEAHLTSTRSIVQYLRAPVLFHPTGGASLGHIRDVAAAYVAALARAEAGQRYILAGLNVTYRQLLATLRQIAGQSAPLPLPTPVARLWGLASQLTSFWAEHPFEEFTAGIASFTGRFNYCDVGKAARVLGYRPPALEQLLRETISDLLAQGMVEPTTPQLRALLSARPGPRQARPRDQTARASTKRLS